jgi:hypothetical protein
VLPFAAGNNQPEMFNQDWSVLLSSLPTARSHMSALGMDMLSHFMHSI